MENKNLTATCEFESEIVPYLYNELAIVEREKFEVHLADCMACTDEFAATSNARYSVFEWRKEEFDALPTPKIVIPELAKAKAATATEFGWFAGLATVFSFARSPLTVVAALLICLGAGFVAITLLRTGDDQIVVANVDAPKNTKSEIATKNTDSDELTAPTDDPEREKVRIEQTTPNRGKTTQTYRVVPANVKSKPVNRRNVVAQKPVLNDLNEEADESLRLADLFDEVGG